MIVIFCNCKHSVESFDEISVATIQKTQALIEEITSKNTPKKKMRAGKNLKPGKTMEGNKEDNRPFKIKFWWYQLPKL